MEDHLNNFTSRNDQLSLSTDTYGSSTLDLLKRPIIPEPSNEIKQEMLFLRSKENKKKELHKNLVSFSSPITGKGEIKAIKEYTNNGCKVENVTYSMNNKRLIGSKYVHSYPNKDNPSMTSLSFPTREKKKSTIHLRKVDNNIQEIGSITKMSTSNTLIPFDENEKDQMALKNEKINLENELLKLTKKLTHKYVKINDKTNDTSNHSRLNQKNYGTNGKWQILAKTWSESNINENKKYDAYMDSRYSSQFTLDFHKKKLENRTDETNFHKIDLTHTKYSNALKLTKNSLRGNF